MMFTRKHENSDRTTLADVLRGTTAARLQSVGYMQVLPLVSDLHDDRFVSPQEARVEVGTSAYGTLVFSNPEDAVLIVPCHAGYVVNEVAQDHAMSCVGLVKRQAGRSFDTAMCVQQTQGGYLQQGRYRMMILPFSLREHALQIRKERGYDRLWDAISAFNSELGISGASHLSYFLDRFRRELDEFVAEFECAPNQVGAIVLIDDRVVGIERAPSASYWASIWPALIRECYGSLAIQVARSKGETPPASRVPLPEEIGSLEELGAAVEEIAAEEERRASALVRELIAEELALERDETVEGFTIDTLVPDRFVGQIVRDDERVVYASIVSSNQAALRAQWGSASPFSI